MRHDAVIIAVKIGQRCGKPVAHGLDLANDDAVAACRNNLFDQTRKDGRPIDLWRGTSGTEIFDPRKPIRHQMIILA